MKCRLVAGLCLATHWPEGSAFRKSGGSDRAAEPLGQCVPRRSLGTRGTRAYYFGTFYRRIQGCATNERRSLAPP